MPKDKQKSRHAHARTREKALIFNFFLTKIHTKTTSGGEVDEDGSEDIDSLHFEISLRGAGAGAFSGAPEGERYDSKQDKGGDGGARAFSGPHQRERYERKPARRSKTEETNPNQRPRKTPARPHPDRRSTQNDTNPNQRARKMPPPPLRAMCFQDAMCLYLPSRLHPLAPR